MEFHVDYWNRLGWTDRFSRSAFTERQQGYAREWKNSNVYTPGFVLDGTEWRPAGNTTLWIGKAPDRVGILSAKKTGRLTFYVSFDSTRSLKSVRVYGALLGNGLESKVNSGENSGSVLKHEFAVLGLAQKKMDGEKKHYTAVIELAQPANEPALSYSAAIWVTGGESQAPLQAVGGDITL